jgi:hypothetical protein
LSTTAKAAVVVGALEVDEIDGVAEVLARWFWPNSGG